MNKLLIIFIVALLLVSLALVLMFSERIIFPESEGCEKCGDDPYEKAGSEKYDHKIFADENGAGNLSERIEDE